MPPPIAALTRELLRDPATINLQRQSAPAVGITQAVYPVEQGLKSALLVALLRSGEMQEALVFTRTKHRANRLADYLVAQGVSAERIHGNRSQAPDRGARRLQVRQVPVLVATDIAARGIDVEALGHVVNFDVPAVPDDYIHRVGRTARAEATGDAFTFVSPEEQSDLQAIEKAIGKRLPRVTLPGFDYAARGDRSRSRSHSASPPSDSAARRNGHARTGRGPRDGAPHRPAAMVHPASGTRGGITGRSSRATLARPADHAGAAAAAGRAVQDGRGSHVAARACRRPTLRGATDGVD